LEIFNWLKVILHPVPAGELSKIGLRFRFVTGYENECLNLDTELTKIEELEYMINLEIASS
jgi:hypothetical protein